MSLTKTKISVLGLVLALSVSSQIASAAYIDFGTLDVHPVAVQNEISKDWFIQYLQPGQKKQEQIEVSNFSAKTKELKLYVADTDVNEGTTFYAKGLDQKSEDMNGWISLPVESLTLKSGESKKFSVNFNVPGNAGVGLHTGAVMVREVVKPDNVSQTYALEKGVRVYLNVTGPAITNGEITGVQTSTSANQITANIQTKNLGTTDYISKGTISLQNIFGQTETEKTDQLKVRPTEEKPLTISIEKPSFGFYHVMFTTENQTAEIGNIVVVPAWTLLIFAALVLLVAFKRGQKAAPSFVALNIGDLFNTAIEKISIGTKTVVFEKSVVYFVLLLTFVSTTLWITSLNPGKTLAQDLNNSKTANSYVLTVKWGNLRHLHLPANFTKVWHGQLSFQNADVEIQDLLNFEHDDGAQLTDSGTTVNFNVTTGPDNDGIKLQIEPKSDEIPTVTFNLDGSAYTYKITDLVGSNFVLNQGPWGVYFNAELGAEHIVGVTELTSELNATGEIEATPEPFAKIPELENLFTADLPATPEVLAEFVLSSDYVQDINKAHETAQVQTDPILIEALQATPEVLGDIAASPDLNFIFIPTETVSFPPQEFSFDEEKITTQEIGTMIFVQNKNENWNTYVGTTDFTSLSGNGSIPASALTVIPGEPAMLAQDGSTVASGDSRRFAGTSDKTTLVEVNPGSDTDSQAIFVLNPTLQIHIPVGTLPGRYRGTLTLTSL